MLTLQYQRGRGVEAEVGEGVGEGAGDSKQVDTDVFAQYCDKFVKTFDPRLLVSALFFFDGRTVALL